MGLELGFEKNNFLENGIRTPLHDPLTETGCSASTCLYKNEFSCKVSDKVGHILSLFLVLNSAVNPLVYAFFKKDIKMEIKKLVCRETQAATATPHDQ